MSTRSWCLVTRLPFSHPDIARQTHLFGSPWNRKLKKILAMCCLATGLEIAKIQKGTMFLLIETGHFGLCMICFTQKDFFKNIFKCISLYLYIIGLLNNGYNFDPQERVFLQYIYSIYNIILYYIIPQQNPTTKEGLCTYKSWISWTRVGLWPLFACSKTGTGYGYISLRISTVRTIWNVLPSGKLT